MCFLSRDARIELDVRWKFCHGHFVTTANLVKLIAAFIDANPFIEDLYKKKKKKLIYDVYRRAMKKETTVEIN